MLYLKLVTAETRLAKSIDRAFRLSLDVGRQGRNPSAFLARIAAIASGA